MSPSFERSIAAWDGDEIVGTAGAFSFRIDRAGRAPCAGGRRHHGQRRSRRTAGAGVLTAMMRRQLDDVRERGEPLAVLTASEPAIYGRFGYGSRHPAADAGDRHHTGPAVRRRRGRDAVRMRLVAPAEALAACEAVYARAGAHPARACWPRQPGWERLPLIDPPREPGRRGPLLCVLAEVDGEVRGYARYRGQGRLEPAGSRRHASTLRDIEALDPVTYAALWRYLSDIDLTAAVTFRNRPADDPVLHLVSDVRRCDCGWRDGLHLRLVDVGAALEARTYAAPVDVVLEVEDPFCPWNAGRWRLAGDAKGATCERTTDAADLALSVRELGAAYLGGFALRALAGAGLSRNCGRARWRRRRRPSAPTWRPGCRTASEAGPELPVGRSPAVTRPGSRAASAPRARARRQSAAEGVRRRRAPPRWRPRAAGVCARRQLALAGGAPERLRAARAAVRTSVPQTRQGSPARR